MKRIILFLGLLLMGFGIGFAQQIVVKDVNITKGGKSNVVVELNNEAVYYGFQFELTLPDGITCYGVINIKSMYKSILSRTNAKSEKWRIDIFFYLRRRDG